MMSWRNSTFCVTVILHINPDSCCARWMDKKLARCKRRRQHKSLADWPAMSLVGGLRVVIHIYCRCGLEGRKPGIDIERVSFTYTQYTKHMSSAQNTNTRGCPYMYRMVSYPYIVVPRLPKALSCFPANITFVMFISVLQYSRSRVYVCIWVCMFALGKASNERWRLLWSTHTNTLTLTPCRHRTDTKSGEFSINTLIRNILGVDVNAVICVYLPMWTTIRY